MSRIDCGNGVTLERGVPLRMRDGVALIADHYYPATGGPQPTLLMRQPYGRDIASTVVYAHPIWFARHGYNVVIQDVRGRGDSEGKFYPFRHEAQDGFDTIAALRQRLESNGKIGMYGFSYQGMTQWLAASQHPEGLVCIAPAQTAHDLYRGWFYQGGALKLASTLGWGLQMLKADARRHKLHEASARLERAWANLAAQYLETPYGRHPAIESEGLPSYVTDWLEHETPSDFWSAMDVSESIASISLPALHLSGWYDTYLAGSIAGYLAAQHADHQYLVAGPWQHIPWGQRIGPHDFGPAANLDTDNLLLRFFNHFLKDTGEFADEPRVRHFALNENRWQSSQTFPAPSSKLQARKLSAPENIFPFRSEAQEPASLVLHLHSRGNANSSRGDGSLALGAPTSQEPPDILSYDPEVPVLAPGGPTNAPGPFNQALLQQGNNVLIYTSKPLQAQVRIFGYPHVEIYAGTSAPHADLTAKLCLVRPNGESIFLSIGILRSTHEPDTPTLFRFALDPTSVLFNPGDRILLEIASSAYPLFDRNPSTAIPPRLASSWNWQRSTQIIHHTPEKPSSLYLPLAEPEP